MLASLAAFAVILRGWLVLSVASNDATGRWPAWGLFAVLPWLIGTILAAAIFALLGYVVFLMGSQFEVAILAAIPPGEVWREVFAKAGYVVAGGIVLWRAPLVARTVAAHAKSYSAIASTT